MPTVDEALAIAVRHHQSGRLSEAESIYGEVLRIDPQHADALHLLGVAAHQQSRLPQAVESIGRAVNIRPNAAEYRNNLAAVYRDAGHLEQAVAGFQDAVRLNPDYADAHYNLGNVLKDLGRFDEAMAAFQRALKIAPSHADSLHETGVVLTALGKHDDAIVCFRRALELNPERHVSRYWLGLTLKQTGAAVEAEKCFRDALAAEPGNPQVSFSLGSVLKEQDKLDEAAECYRAVFRNFPAEPLRDLWMASLCPSIFQTSETILRYRENLLSELNRIAEAGMKLSPEQIDTHACPPPFELQYHGLDNRPLKEAYARIFEHCFRPPAPARRTGRPRIGFVVTDGYEGIFRRSMQGILQRLDPQEFDIKTICTASGAAMIGKDGSADTGDFLVIPNRFLEAVDRISRANFDVLYYWEVGSDVTNYFLPFFQLAPVQCTGWGSPDTTGIPQMQYFLSSALVETEHADQHYSEQLIRCDTLLTWQTPLPIPDNMKRREDFGFSNSQNLYLCVQQVRKIHPDFDRLVEEIVHRDPHAVMIFVEDRRRFAAERLRDRLHDTIPDAVGRIVFLPQQSVSDYLSLVFCADVLVDTPHFGGGFTTYDAFALNKPLVTLPSTYRRSRYAAACYLMMGIDDCVVSTAAEYVETAVQLGTDADFRRAIEARIGKASPVLFENVQAVREFERVLRKLAAEARSR